jgi:hypothetical protein
MWQVYDGFLEITPMRMSVWTTVFLFGISAGIVAAQTPAQNQPQAMPMGGMEHMGGMDHMGGMEPSKAKPMVPAGPLKITFGDKSAEWTPATLAALLHKTVTVYNMHAKANQAYSGVLLMDLLVKLGVPEKQHGKDLHLYLVAVGSDGFEAVYSVAEVNPNLHDSTVIVADAVEGKPLADAGPLQLVSAGDKLPSRSVRNLVAIRVLSVE